MEVPGGFIGGHALQQGPRDHKANSKCRGGSAPWEHYKRTFHRPYVTDPNLKKSAKSIAFKPRSEATAERGVQKAQPAQDAESSGKVLSTQQGHNRRYIQRPIYIYE